MCFGSVMPLRPAQEAQDKCAMGGEPPSSNHQQDVSAQERGERHANKQNHACPAQDERLKRNLHVLSQPLNHATGNWMRSCLRPLAQPEKKSTPSSHWPESQGGGSAKTCVKGKASPK
jgi:hypothetical protein